MKSARFADTLKLLARHHVEFIVVGMTAGVLQGAPVTTLVLDLAALIEIKKRAGRPKDLAAIPVLEATADERARKHRDD